MAERKQIQMFLVTCLVLLTLAGGTLFGGGSAESDEEPTIRFAVAMDPARLKLYEAAVEEFNASDRGFTVVLENTPWSEYWQKLQTQTASGTMPDVWNYVPGFGQEWLENGLLLPIDQYVEASDMDLADFIPGMLDFMRYEGNLYGLPYDMSGHILFFNKELFDQAGLDYPTEEWTFADVRAAAETIVSEVESVEGERVYGFGNYMNSSWSSAGYYKSFGGDFVTPDLEVEIDSQGSIDALQYFVDLRNDGLAPPPTEAGIGDTAGGQFITWLTGRSAMILDGPWAIPTYVDTVEFDFDVVPVPAGPAQRAPSLLGGTFVIDKDTDYPQEAFEFLAFITSESQLETIVAESGAGIPGRQSAFDKMTPLMEKAANYIMQTNQAFYPVRGSFAIFDKQNSEFELIFNGEKSVEEGLTAVAAFARNVVRENYGE